MVFMPEPSRKLLQVGLTGTSKQTEGIKYKITIRILPVDTYFAYKFATFILNNSILGR